MRVILTRVSDRSPTLLGALVAAAAAGAFGAFFGASGAFVNSNTNLI